MTTLLVDTLVFLGLAVGAFAFMEGFAWFTHKYVMHGFMWVWHRSHHEPRLGVFELNDLFAVVFAAPAIVAIWFGTNGGVPWLLPIGVGITGYGLMYFLFHDGLVHRRFPMWGVHSPIWKRAIQAHRLHHAVHTKEGAVSFGFLVAPTARRLKAQLAEIGSKASG